MGAETKPEHSLPQSFVSTAAELHRSESQRQLCALRLHEEKRRALTASYIVEFAEAIGLPMSPLADVRSQDFNAFNAVISDMVSNATRASADGRRNTTPSSASSAQHSQYARRSLIMPEPAPGANPWHKVHELGQCECQRLLTLEEFLMVSTSGPMLPDGELRLLEDFLSAAQLN